MKKTAILLLRAYYLYSCAHSPATGSSVKSNKHRSPKTREKIIKILTHRRMVIMHSRKEKKLLFPYFLCISLRESNCCRDVIFRVSLQFRFTLSPCWGRTSRSRPSWSCPWPGGAARTGGERKKTEMQTFKMFAFSRNTPCS